jgi:hypothetical protein
MVASEKRRVKSTRKVLVHAPNAASTLMYSGFNRDQVENIDSAAIQNKPIESERLVPV